ncbi:hypothetical protein [Bacillus alkalisoli]|uniref:hypothetical protein n=1 Tax=Bacillus alkalisoli TaxID=2011008 RepID=UPI000C2394CC|nr:hypothetical protein [Bacillus alkalisoli]
MTPLQNEGIFRKHFSDGSLVERIIIKSLEKESISNEEIDELKRGIFEKALIINAGGSRFFYIKSEEEVVLPVNIRGFSETGELIYSTYN